MKKIYFILLFLFITILPTQVFAEDISFFTLYEDLVGQEEIIDVDSIPKEANKYLVYSTPFFIEMEKDEYLNSELPDLKLIGYIDENGTKYINKDSKEYQDFINSKEFRQYTEPPILETVISMICFILLLISHYLEKRNALKYDLKGTFLFCFLIIIFQVLAFIYNPIIACFSVVMMSLVYLAFTNIKHNNPTSFIGSCIMSLLAFIFIVTVSIPDINEATTNLEEQFKTIKFIEIEDNSIEG